MSNASSAISSSADYNQIRTIDHRDDGAAASATKAELRDLCEDCIENAPDECTGSLVSEYWGTDDNGKEWRVHVVSQGAN